MRRILRSKSLNSQSDGYTLIEMIIGTTLLGVLIVLCISVFILIGRIYYKGYYERQTQDVAKNLADSIYESIIIFNALPPAPKSVPGTDGWMTLCFGNTQYTYVLDKQLVSSDILTNNPNNKRITANSLIVSQVSQCPILLNPADSARGIVIPSIDGTQDKKISGGVELLRENMRLLEFSITEANSHGCKKTEDLNGNNNLDPGEDTYIANGEIDEWDGCPAYPYTNNGNSNIAPTSSPGSVRAASKDDQEIFVSPSLWDISIKIAYGGQAEDCPADDQTFITYVESDGKRDHQDDHVTFVENAVCNGTGNYKDEPIKIERCELDQSFCAVISIYTRALSLRNQSI